MSVPDAYISFLVEFHASRDLFECHELLEEHWKKHPEHPHADLWVGLIQLAVGLYHQRRGNVPGARKMLAQALHRLEKGPLEQLGIDKQHALEQLSGRLRDMESPEGLDYKDLDLRILDSEIALLCEKQCALGGLRWGSPSPMHEAALIHRHTLRDRSDVIAARRAAYEAKQQKRDRIT